MGTASARWWSELARPWTDAMTEQIASAYGLWTIGWRYNTSEPGNGGPVAGWCCERDSIRDPASTVAAVADCIVEWHDWLVELDERFQRFLPLPNDPDDRHDVWQRAVAHLITVVVDRTHAEDAWYRHCAQVLGWFLSCAGVPDDRHRELVQEAIGGRFYSWLAPPDQTVREVADRLAGGLAPDAHG
jgi:hypothetical protein